MVLNQVVKQTKRLADTTAEEQGIMMVAAVEQPIWQQQQEYCLRYHHLRQVYFLLLEAGEEKAITVTLDRVEVQLADLNSPTPVIRIEEQAGHKLVQVLYIPHVLEHQYQAIQEGLDMAEIPLLVRLEEVAVEVFMVVDLRVAAKAEVAGLGT